MLSIHSTSAGGAPGEAPRQALVRFLHPHSRSSCGHGQTTPRPQAPGGKASPTSALLSFSLCWPVLATAAPHRPPSQDAPHRQAPPRGCSGGWARRPGPCRVGWGEGGLGGRGSVGPARLPAALAWPHPASSLTWHRLPGLQPCTSQSSPDMGAPSPHPPCLVVHPEPGRSQLTKPVAVGSALRASLTAACRSVPRRPHSLRK